MGSPQRNSTSQSFVKHPYQMISLNNLDSPHRIPSYKLRYFADACYIFI